MDKNDLKIGSLPKGANNKITDVPGVLVGHTTIDTETHKTGVTVVVTPVSYPFAPVIAASRHLPCGGYLEGRPFQRVDKVSTR